ncbi:unnamed protein product [Rhizoctonia solani]|uniref:Uncharacterized protein n=1 Tax=Rhizoctonia solani TaxID=456999 RepID=A0A8H3A6V1_9AGAM|nr:unnamed protein product [Rhizoctonia solani]
MGCRIFANMSPSVASSPCSAAPSMLQWFPSIAPSNLSKKPGERESVWFSLGTTIRPLTSRYKSRTSPPRPCQSQTDPSYLRPSTGNPYWLISVGDLDLGLIPDDIAESGGPTRQVMRSPAKVDSSIPRLLHTDADGWRANAQ